MNFEEKQDVPEICPFNLITSFALSVFKKGRRLHELWLFNDETVVQRRRRWKGISRLGPPILFNSSLLWLQVLLQGPLSMYFPIDWINTKGKKPRISHARDKGRCYATHRGSILDRDRPIAIKTLNNRATSMNRDKSLLEVSSTS